MVSQLHLLVLGLAALGVACGQEGPRRVEQTLVFKVLDDRGKAVSGSRIRIGTSDLGASDASGELSAKLTGPDGGTLPMNVECPEGFSAARAPELIHFRQTRRLVRDGDSARKISITCPRRERRVAVVVRAPGGKNLPVMVDGVERANTGSGQLAHLSLSGPPGKTVRLLMEPDAHSGLLPARAEKVLRIAEHDEIVLFEQEFRAPAPKKKRRRRHRRKGPPQPRRPVRIQ
jgi:hypothetical protein